MTKQNNSRGCLLLFEHISMGSDTVRPIPFLDGTFLRGRHEGQLFGATRKFGNQGIISLSISSCSKYYGTINSFTRVLT